MALALAACAGGDAGSFADPAEATDPRPSSCDAMEPLAELPIEPVHCRIEHVQVPEVSSVVSWDPERRTLERVSENGTTYLWEFDQDGL